MGILVAYHPHDPHINSLSYLPSKPDHKGERAGQGFLVSLETLTQLAQKPQGPYLFLILGIIQFIMITIIIRVYILTIFYLYSILF